MPSERAESPVWLYFVSDQVRTHAVRMHVHVDSSSAAQVRTWFVARARVRSKPLFFPCFFFHQVSRRC